MRLKENQPQKPLKKRFLKGRKKLGKMLENVGKELEECWEIITYSGILGYVLKDVLLVLVEKAIRFDNIDGKWKGIFHLELLVRFLIKHTPISPNF